MNSQQFYCQFSIKINRYSERGLKLSTTDDVNKESQSLTVPELNNKY